MFVNIKLMQFGAIELIELPAHLEYIFSVDRHPS